MSKVVKIAFIAAIAAFMMPVIMTTIADDLSTAQFGLAMSISLILVLGIYSAIKEKLFNEMQGEYNRRPLFKAGITVSVLVALLHSFGVMLNETIHVDKLFIEREKASLEGLKEANTELERLESMDDRSPDSDSTMVRIKEYIETETRALEIAREHEGEVHIDLASLGAKTIIWDMLWGVIYSIAIPYILKFSPQFRNKK